MTDLNNLNNRKYLTLKHLKNAGVDLLGMKNARQILYHHISGDYEIPKCHCGKDLNWHNDSRKYRDFCSKKCTAKFTVEKREQTSIEKYGVSHHSKLDNFSEKIKKTSLERYGVEHYSKTDEHTERMKESNLKNYGVEYPIVLSEFQEKMKQTNLEKYGAEHPSQVEEIKQKIRQTKLERYGDENYTNHEKAKKTNVEKYGAEYSFQVPQLREKAKKIKLERYGDENYTNHEKASRTIKNRYNRNSPRQISYSDDIWNKLNDYKWLVKQNDTHTVKEIASELNVSVTTIYKRFQHYNIQPKNFFISNGEKEIASFIEGLGIDIIQNDRSILKGKELDIYIPNYNLAIEFNGIYWHSELTGGKDKHYHVNKTDLCESQDIQLLHIFNNEWDNPTKKEIWKSMIKHRLGLSNKIYARKCSLKELSQQEAKSFFDENHLQGFMGGGIKLGLYHGETLMQANILGKPRYNKNFDYELIRSATLKNHAVIGGLSKLMKNINGKVISYADRRYSLGNGYKSIGMKMSHKSNPNFYYTSDLYTLESRQKYQKHKLSSILEQFDGNLTAEENLFNHGFDRIWDCGNWVMTRNA